MEHKENYLQSAETKLSETKQIIDVALGDKKADLVIKNAEYVNVFTNEICKSDIAICNNTIAGIGEYDGENIIDAAGQIVFPGLIDSHIHLESSLCMPSEFAKAVLSHGTTTVVVDPHEIANVMGLDGIRFMLEATENLPIDVIFMMPSCVPATPMDESGAVITPEMMEEFFNNPRVLGLAEMMNYVGVINKDDETLKKIALSQCKNKIIDGHAPSLSGKDLTAYIAAGVYSDHECDTYENALEKIRLGQNIMIREGTAAKNLAALVPLLNQNYSERCMFATDDKHPNDLLKLGHIDYIIKKATELGANPIIAVKTASYNAAQYFSLNHKGAIAPGYVADLVIADNLNDFNVKKVVKNGNLVFDGEIKTNITSCISKELNTLARNTFNLRDTVPADFKAGELPLIGIIPGEIITENLGVAEKVDVDCDILKIAVVERHNNTGHIGIGYIKGYNLKGGAVATSIAHDSHNIIAVGTNDDDISFAVNRIKHNNGGIVVLENQKVLSELPLPIAGLISDMPIKSVNEALENTKNAAYKLGVSKSVDPFMTLSFMSLPVIPKLKITTKGVFDVEKWKYL